MHHIGFVKKVHGTEHFEQDFSSMHLRKPNLVLFQDFLEVALDIIHDDKNVRHVFGDKGVQHFDCVHIFLHLGKLPQDLNLPQDSLKIIMLILLKITFDKFDGYLEFFFFIPGSHDHGASSLADDSVDYVSVF